MSIPATQLSGNEPKPLSNPSSQDKGPLGLGNVVELDNWQAYVYLGAMFILTVQIAKNVFQGEFSGALLKSGFFATTLMGKVNTDYACAQFSLLLIANSMQAHVGNLEFQVGSFEEQLQESHQQLAQFGHENETYYQHNAAHRGQIEETRRILGEYSDNLKRTVEEERQALEELRQEITVGNEEKRQLKLELTEDRRALEEIKGQALRVQQNLLYLSEQAAERAHDPEALRLLIERARSFTPSHIGGCGSPMTFGSPHFNPLNPATPIKV